MLVRFYEAFLGFPKWFQFGLCPIAYVVVGILVSHFYSWKMAKNKKMGCGEFSISESGWGTPRHCPANGLCSGHDSWDTFFSVMMFLSVVAWPLTLSAHAIGYFGYKFIIGTYKSFDWLWSIPDRALEREWKKLDCLVELLRKKYKDKLSINIKKSDRKADVLLFHLTYQEKLLIGAFRSARGFAIHPHLIKMTENRDIYVDDESYGVDRFPEVQSVYYEIVKLLEKG